MEYRHVLETGAVLADQFRIDSVLGSGGFGITYLAHDIGLNSTIVLKEYFPAQIAVREATQFVHPRSQGELTLYQWGLERFVREAQILDACEHPHIVRVRRVFVANNTAYMALNYVDGPNFEAWLKALGRAPTQSELDGIYAPLLDALEYIHSRPEQILHRDIAPDNIIIHPKRGPVLIDFGAARVDTAGRSQSKAGTVKDGYSPKEQHSQRPEMQGPWTDIYSTGATLWRAVTGQRPPDCLDRDLADDMPRLAAQAPAGYRPSFLAAIDAAMSMDRKDRPQSIGAWRQMMDDTEPKGPVPPEMDQNPETLPVPSPDPSPVPPSPWTSPRTMMLVALALLMAGGVYFAFGRGSGAVALANLAASECDRLARAPSDDHKGVEFPAIDAPAALQHCRKAMTAFPAETRYTLALGRAFAKSNDAVGARQLYEKAAAEGDAVAMAYLGNFNESGVAGPQDLAKARDWYERAAAKGLSHAMNNLGVLYGIGRGVPRSQVTAREWYEKAAAKGNADAENNLGILYRDGDGIRQDHRQSRAWFEKSARQGNARGMTNLASAYWNGIGGVRDLAKALEWYDKAAALGNPIAARSIAAAYGSGQGVQRDPVKSLEWYEKGAALGDSELEYFAGAAYRDGLGATKDPAKAREWFEKAANRGHILAANELGFMFYSGQAGLTQDFAKAREWFEKSAVKGFALAMRNIAFMFDKGQGGPANPSLAATNLLNAAKGGEARAQAILSGDLIEWSTATRKALQEQLRASGLLAGPASETWDDASRAAAKRHFTAKL